MSDASLAREWYELGLLDELREEFCAALMMRLLTREALRDCFAKNVELFEVVALRHVDAMTPESFVRFLRDEILHEKKKMQEVCLYLLENEDKSDEEIHDDGIRMIRNMQWLHGDADDVGE